MKRAVFLDRDGVINRAEVRDGMPRAPGSVEETQILPGVPEALRRLRAAGYGLVVVTNQPEIARGRTTRAIVDAIHARLRAELGLDDIRVCPHDDGDACACRKPKPGLLLQAPRYDMATSAMVGDRWRDVEAGRAAGCGVTILVDYGYDEPVPHEPDARVASLAEAADWLLAREARSTGVTGR
ncbi:MAG: D-glycero-alpha-D-manno-heptose-1,7-bisphosphate 7-phosphatase [Vicinamibacterales bacterium]